MQSWTIHTRSGSLYRIAVDSAGRWWISGDNVRTPISSYLGDGCWEIQPPSPWPPQIGSPLTFLAPPHLEIGDPNRIPGGGKVTSPVVDITAVSAL